MFQLAQHHFTLALYLLKKFGYPSSTNPYVFNGDFVDRGYFSVEVILMILMLKVAYPEYVSEMFLVPDITQHNSKMGCVLYLCILKSKFHTYVLL